MSSRYELASDEWVEEPYGLLQGSCSGCSGAMVDRQVGFITQPQWMLSGGLNVEDGTQISSVNPEAGENILVFFPEVPCNLSSFK